MRPGMTRRLPARFPHFGDASAAFSAIDDGGRRRKSAPKPSEDGAVTSASVLSAEGVYCAISRRSSSFSDCVSSLHDRASVPPCDGRNSEVVRIHRRTGAFQP